MSAALILVPIAFAAGLAVGLRVKHRRYLVERAKREPLDQRMDAYRLADTRTDLDEVAGATTGRRTAELYQQTDTETLPGTGLRCGRCGSGVAYYDCNDCVGDGGYEDDDENGIFWRACDTCDGGGSFPYCKSLAEWCRANPMAGREGTPMSAIEEAHPIVTEHHVVYGEAP